jgi:hypothetical protein
MSIPYVYKIKNIVTGKYYIGVQYGKSAHPINFWNTYFTSNKYVKENKSQFIVVYIRPRKDALEYERKFLSRLYYFYGKNKFFDLMYNRNLAPGILHDEDERLKISNRMKKRWAQGKMNEAHKKATATRNSKEYSKYNHSPEVRKKISERMKDKNPMFNDEVRKKHKESMNSENVKNKKSEIAKGNTYTKGRSWYNNGKESKMFYVCPEGWTKGRLNPHWNYKRKKKINENTSRIKTDG